MRNESLDYLIANDEKKRGLLHINRQDEFESLKVLTKNKPDYLGEDEWDRLIKKAIVFLKESLSVYAKSVYLPDRLLSVLKMEKPANFPLDDWENLHKEVEQAFLFLKQQKLLIAMPSSQNILKEIKSPKPDGLSDDLWANHIQLCRKAGFLQIAAELEIKWNAVEYLRELDLEAFERKERGALEEKAYNVCMTSFKSSLLLRKPKDILDSEKPPWMKELDSAEIQRAAQDKLDIEVQSAKYKALLDLVNRLSTGIPLKEKRPTTIPEEEWNNLQEMDKKLRATSEENQSVREELIAEKNEIHALKAKVDKQLETINTFLNDPDVLERIAS